MPNSVLFQNYISTVSKAKYFNIFFDFDEIANDNLNEFSVLCLFKARFAGEKVSNDTKYCNQNYPGYENLNEIEVLDYKIIFLKKFNDK